MVPVLDMAKESMLKVLEPHLEYARATQGVESLYINLCVASGGSKWTHCWSTASCHNAFHAACKFLGLPSTSEAFGVDVGLRMGRCYEHGTASVVTLARFLHKHNLRLRSDCSAYVTVVWSSKWAGWLSGALMEDVCTMLVDKVVYDDLRPNLLILGGSHSSAGNSSYQGGDGTDPRALWAAVIMLLVRKGDTRQVTRDELEQEKTNPWAFAKGAQST